MKIIFQETGKRIQLVDAEQDVVYADEWYEEWMEYEGLEEPLKAESEVEPEWEIDDAFGKYGFKNKAGEFVIEPQYAYAYEFTNGLAAVNLNRTWYRTEEGKRYYENHYGYIDSKGKTIIGFQFEEARPFNKYGVAVVYDIQKGYMLIDKNGTEIPGTRFEYLSPYYDYNDRFLEFSYEYKNGEELTGIYDTKERKILLEPSIDSIIEWEEDCIEVFTRNGKYGLSDFHVYYIDSKGEILYPWLYGKEFSRVLRPDKNNICAVALSQYTELTGEPKSYFSHNGKKYKRTFLYGLYSSKGEYLLPPEYEEIRKMGDNRWLCNKGEEWLLVETEEGD